MKWCFLHIIFDVIVFRVNAPCSPELGNHLPAPPEPGAVIAKREIEGGCIVSYRTTILRNDLPDDWRGV